MRCRANDDRLRCQEYDAIVYSGCHAVASQIATPKVEAPPGSAVARGPCHHSDGGGDARRRNPVAIRAGVYVVKPKATQVGADPESAVADLTFAQLVDRFVTGKLEKLNIDTWTDERGRLKRMAAVNLPDLNCPLAP